MKVLTVCFFLLFAIVSQTQPPSDAIDKRVLLFNEFTEGKVLLKSGRVETVLMNYNTDNQSIIFVQQNNYVILTGLETVDTIYLKGKKYIPIANKVCELVTIDGSWNLLATYINKPQPITATTDKSGTAQKSTNQVDNTVTNEYVSRNYKSNFQVRLLPQFWIQYKGKLYRVSSKKQLLKNVNPEFRSNIEAYLEGKDVSFENEADMIALLHHVAQLK